MSRIGCTGHNSPPERRWHRSCHQPFSMPRATLTKAAMILHGLTTLDFKHGAELSPKVKAALEPLLSAEGFVERLVIRVEELPDNRGFRLTQ